MIQFWAVDLIDKNFQRIQGSGVFKSTHMKFWLYRHNKSKGYWPCGAAD